jgi:hypothetical protein
MNNLYHKVAVASVGIALGFALGANKEAKAATFNLTPSRSFLVEDSGQDGVGDSYFDTNTPAVGIRLYREFRTEYRGFYEFNIANLSLAPNIVVNSAILQIPVNNIEWYGVYFRLQAYGYIANETAEPQSLFNAGDYLDEEYLDPVMNREPVGIFNFNVLPFINQSIRNNDSSAGFGIRFFDEPYTDNEEGFLYLQNSRLTITTVDSEPVPEPTTIFGSAIGLFLGGWVKRRKSALQNKTTSQN